MTDAPIEKSPTVPDSDPLSPTTPIVNHRELSSPESDNGGGSEVDKNHQNTADPVIIDVTNGEERDEEDTNLKEEEEEEEEQPKLTAVLRKRETTTEPTEAKQMDFTTSAKYYTHLTSALYFSLTNPLTYVLLVDFLQTILKGYFPEKITDDNEHLKILNYILSCLSFGTLGFGNTKTYLAYVNKLFGLEKTEEKSKSTEQQPKSTSPKTDEQPNPTSPKTDEKSKLTPSELAKLIITNFNALIKGGVASTSFATVAANIVGNFFGLTDKEKGLFASFLATVTLPVNVYSQSINFKFGTTSSKTNPVEKKSSETTPTENKSFWDKLSYASKMLYPITSPLTYNVTFERNFPILVAQVMNLILPHISKEDLQNDKYVQGLSSVINVVCYFALAYDTWKLYHQMAKKDKDEKKQSNPTTPSPEEAINLFQQCAQYLAETSCAKSIAATMKRIKELPYINGFFESLPKISKHIASNSKGLISSLGFAEFVCQTIGAFFPETSEDTLAIINMSLCAIGLVLNTPAQYASFSIAAKDKEKKSPAQKTINTDTDNNIVVHNEQSFSERSFASFRSPPNGKNGGDSVYGSFAETGDEGDLDSSRSRSDSSGDFSRPHSNSISSILDDSESQTPKKNKENKKRKLPGRTVIDAGSWRTIEKPEIRHGNNSPTPHSPMKPPQKKKSDTHPKTSKTKNTSNSSRFKYDSKNKNLKTPLLKEHESNEKTKSTENSKSICLVM
ncbi:MAG TPA: hypothetical protein VHE99_11015 [Gammaproteobacteria bacterium]|nr:hypothetical protein [Gammaproteobacteria bacterium]